MEYTPQQVGEAATVSPAISVIVPVYKAEKYLRRCVDSILAQTFTDFEVLLIDDGSPDRSGEICDEYAAKDSRVRVFHQANGGVSAARQRGTDEARGEYTIHADPDDWVEPTMLEELYAKAKAEDADMVICDYYVNMGGRQRYVKQQPSALDSETVLRELFQQLHGSCCNKLVRRACYNRLAICFPKNISLSEDLYVNLRLARGCTRFAYVARAYYHYVQDANANSISRDRSRRQVQQMDEMHAAFHELLRGTPYDRLFNRRMFGDAYALLMFRVLNGDEFRERFSLLSNEPAYDFFSRTVKLALRHYRTAQIMASFRETLGRAYNRLKR